MRTFLKFILYPLLGIIGFVLCYFCFATISSKWPINAESTSQNKVIQLYILSNGVHTDLVMPVHSEWHNWETEFPYSNTLSRDTSFNYIGVGWGDKGFYLNTPTWGDLTAKVAFNAMFGLSTTAIHATFHDTLETGENCKAIYLTEPQYHKLIEYIQQSLQYSTTQKTVFIKTDAVYGKNDAFYEAKGSYHLFHTCNTWTNSALKVAGQKACLWTPFQSGILNQYTP